MATNKERKKPKRKPDYEFYGRVKVWLDKRNEGNALVQIEKARMFKVKG